jgi:4-hydroxyphenylpyruvate dioxygenase
MTATEAERRASRRAAPGIPAPSERDQRPAQPRLAGVDHVEWWVGNARHTAAFFERCFGFTVVAYAGPETGFADRTSYVLEQGTIRWVVTSPLTSDGEIVEHVLAHGDGVRTVAFAVDDVAAAFGALVARGARAAREPWAVDDPAGELVRAELHAYGDTRHQLIGRSGYAGAFAPGYDAVDPSEHDGPTGLRAIDHIVANVERGRLDDWVEWYQRVFGFTELTHFDEEQISTEHSALRSTVVWDGPEAEAEPTEGEAELGASRRHDRVVLPINEPADGLRRSQIEEYLDYYGGPGVQHLALATDDIVTTVGELRRRGVRFLDVPPAYYDSARERLAGVDLPWERLAELGILVDRDATGHLLQIFTENVASRPTVFLEIIQRAGAHGFGEGNFKALFEAIEREQARRGNL